MKAGRGFFIHIGLVILAVLAAVGVWTRDKQPKSLAQGDVVVWSTKGDVERVVFEGKTKTVTLDSKKDESGRYFVATVNKQASAPKDSGDPDTDGDGGAPNDEKPAEHPAEPASTKITFVSVTAGQKLVDSLSPLKALRALGRISDDRSAEFGLGEPEATLTVKLGGEERKLIFGGPTPGGGDRYARDPSTGDVYAIKGDVFRNLETAESTLMERELHEWKEADVTGANVTAAGKSREVTRGGVEGKKFWADPASADANDETFGNWISKLDRLRPTEYAGMRREAVELIARIDYKGSKGKLGFIELVKGPPDRSGKPEYLILTERLRLYAKVSPQLAEQVEQDLSSIVK